MAFRLTDGDDTEVVAGSHNGRVDDGTNVDPGAHRMSRRSVGPPVGASRAIASRSRWWPLSLARVAWCPQYVHGRNGGDGESIDP